MTGADTFAGTTLGHRSGSGTTTRTTADGRSGNGLRLQTATVTNDLYAARNTLTHRIQGPTSTATIELDYSTMANGDRAGLAMLRDSSAWIGVRRDNGTTRVVMTNGLTMDSSWNTTGTGTEARRRRRLRRPDLVAGQRRHPTRHRPPGPLLLQHRRHQLHQPRARRSRSTTPGSSSWATASAIFNYATQALGGAVTVRRFDLTTP